MGFKALGLHPAVLKGVEAMGFTDPSPIQLRAIPEVLAGKDFIGSAQTGTGKTAAFGLPILSKLEEGKSQPGQPRCLVLEPTRELAAQVETAFRDYGRFCNLKTLVIYGGVGFDKQKRGLKGVTDTVIATPGRLLDHLQDGAVDFSGLEFLVLDEVDRMLDMGFLPDVRRIVEKTRKERQTLLLTATLPPEIERLASWVLHNPVIVEIGARRCPADSVDHAFYPVAADQKFDLLLALLDRTNYDSVLIFVRTKESADRIASRLRHANHSVAVLHSNRTQREREEALNGFKSGRYEVMVATDIASRGLDISGVSHVINFDIPQHPEDYVHRIGRTGRASATGTAFTLVVAEEAGNMQAIERFIGRSIERKKLDGFNYFYTALFDEHTTKALGGGGVRGGRHMSGYSFGTRRNRR